MSTQNAKFKTNISRFAKKVSLDLDVIVRKVALDILKAVIGRTPVDTGALKGSWVVQQAISPTDPGTIDQRGAATIARGADEVARFTVGGHLYIMTYLPYAIEIENGASQQAPSGMVKITVTEFRQYLKRQASLLRAA